MSENKKRPFIAQFVEDGPPGGEIRRVLYSEVDGVNYVQAADGALMPAVGYGTLGTATRTDVRSENTDTDPGDDAASAFSIGTSTLSEARGEATDTDPSDDHTGQAANCHFPCEPMVLIHGMPHTVWPMQDAGMGTETQTRAKTENTDRD